MYGYTFRLERILNLKKEIEDIRKRELSEAIIALRKEIERREEIESEISEVMDEMRTGQKVGWNPLRYISAHRYLSHLNAELQNQASRIRKADLEVNRRREKTIQAIKERKIFEKLRDRDYRRFLEKLSKGEMTLLDMVTTNGYHRKSTQMPEGVM